MKTSAVAFAGSAALLLWACDAGTAPVQQPAEQSAATSAEAASGALGLTERQLRDAALLDAQGREIGDVEGVVRGADRAVAQLLIEIEDSDPDRYVLIPLDGLQVDRTRGDADIKSSLTREDLMALPPAPAR